MESSLICLWGHRALYKTLTGSHMAGPKRTGLWQRGSLYQEVWLKAATEDFSPDENIQQYKQVILICMSRNCEALWAAPGDTLQSGLAGLFCRAVLEWKQP